MEVVGDLNPYKTHPYTCIFNHIISHRERR
nr:MAG TPA: hypothetical protein [Caudoviricetes sp.]DAR81295.1 MAG TPA: hypothetical protein [Caudoviricetes sp.]